MDSVTREPRRTPCSSGTHTCQGAEDSRASYQVSSHGFVPLNPSSNKIFPSQTFFVTTVCASGSFTLCLKLWLYTKMHGVVVMSPSVCKYPSRGLQIGVKVRKIPYLDVWVVLVVSSGWRVPAHQPQSRIHLATELEPHPQLYSHLYSKLDQFGQNGH